MSRRRNGGKRPVNLGGFILTKVSTAIYDPPHPEMVLWKKSIGRRIFVFLRRKLGHDNTWLIFVMNPYEPLHHKGGFIGIEKLKDPEGDTLKSWLVRHKMGIL